jgi:hypothetical protein
MAAPTGYAGGADGGADEGGSRGEGGLRQLQQQGSSGRGHHEKAGAMVNKKWGCFCGVRSPGDGTGENDVEEPLLPQRRMNHFLIVDSKGVPASAEEGARLIGTMIRPGFEDKDAQVGERDAAFCSVRMHGCYLEYYCEDNISACTLWVRGDLAWYRLGKPAACYEEAYQHSANRLRIGDVLKTQLLKTPKVSFDRLFQVVSGKVIAFLAPMSVKQRLREKMTRALIMADAPYIVSCIDDVSEVLHKGESNVARMRRRDFGDKLVTPLRVAAATVEGEKSWDRLCAAGGLTRVPRASTDGGDVGGEGGGDRVDADHKRGENGPLGLLGSLPSAEALQVCCALDEACLGAHIDELRRQRDKLMRDSRSEDEIRSVLDSMIDKIVKLSALPRGKVLCEGKSKTVIDYCRTVVDFLEICGPGLFHTSEKPTDLVPPEPAKLMAGMTSRAPSDAIVRLHLKLLAILNDTFRADSEAIAAADLLTWPETLRSAMEEDLLRRAEDMVLERKENGEAINIDLDMYDDDDVGASARANGGADAGAADESEWEENTVESQNRRHARAYLRYYAEYFADELEVVEHLKKECYTSMPEELRWRALDWLCSTVSEKEGEYGLVREEFERRMAAGRRLEKLQDQMRGSKLEQLSPDLRAVAHALNAVLVEDTKLYGWFSEPVDAEKLGLTDYHEVIKTPMDLGTVLSNVLRVPTHYEGPNSAIRDVRQVWINARTYNGRSSPVTKAAGHLEALFDSALAAAREGNDGAGLLGVQTEAASAEALKLGEERERAAAVRSEPVGKDRLGRCYYWDGASLLVENAGQSDGLEPLCQYQGQSDLAQLLDFLDESEREDSQLKRWLLAHRADFEADAVPREDAAGAWTAPDGSCEDAGSWAYAQNLGSLLLEQGMQLRDALLSHPTPLRVRAGLHLLLQLRESWLSDASAAAHCAEHSTESKKMMASLRDHLLALENALSESDALPVGWTEMAGVGKQWRRMTGSAQTTAALGLQIVKLRDAALENIGALGNRLVTRAQWLKGCKNRRFLCPEPSALVTYLCRGHQEHLDRYGKRPWDDGARQPVCEGGEMCQVESIKYFSGVEKQELPFAVVQLRSLQVAAGRGEGVAGAVVAAAGGTSGGSAADEAEGQVFFTTLHSDNSLSEMLIDSASYTRSLAPWKEGESVKMWFADSSGVGGSFYHGTVVSQAVGGEVWDSITVRWEDGEELQVRPSQH